MGKVSRLNGYTVGTVSIRPGESLDVKLVWTYLAAMSRDWTVTVGLFNSDNEIVVQADGFPPGYPTSSAQPGTTFADERELLIPSETPVGDYRLFVGWYDGDERLPLQGVNGLNDLFIAPEVVSIAGSG